MREQVKFDDLLIYAFLDPAGGKRAQAVKKIRARSAIVVVGADYLQRMFVLYTWADRASTPQIIEKVFEVQEHFHPRQFGCEANAQQSLFADALRYVAKAKARALTLVPVIQDTKITKEFRIRSVLQPVIANGRLLLQANQHELRTEITAFPTGMTVDLVDALASAVALVPKITRQELDVRADNQLQSYLEDSGLSPEEIELTMQQLGQEDGDAGPLELVKSRWSGHSYPAGMANG